MKRFVLILLLLPFGLFAQVKITGRVVNEMDNTPLVSASVFLSNATVGDKTDEQGRFTLNYVKPGQYELVISIVGFEGYKKIVMIASEAINIGDIKLLPKTIALNEVKIRPDFNRGKYLQEFIREFLGTSDVARQAIIANPDVINLDYDPKTKVLTADSGPDYIDIENKALGYKIKYYLKTFVKDNKANRVFYEGSTLYEPLEGTPSQQRRWQKKRNAVYTGSTIHFLRDVIANQVDKDFVILKNMVKMRAFGGGGMELQRDSLPVFEYARRTDKPGLFALKFKDPIFIWYAPVRFNKSAVQQERERGILMSKITLLKPVSFFDMNGVIINPESALFEYRWGAMRVGDQLPVDFEPTDEQ